jgi:hypothetical protein
MVYMLFQYMFLPMSLVIEREVCLACRCLDYWPACMIDDCPDFQC